MRTHAEIISAAGAETVRSGLQLGSIHTVRSWAARNSIPAEHWAGLIALGMATSDELIAAAANRAGCATGVEGPKRPDAISEAGERGRGGASGHDDTLPRAAGAGAGKIGEVFP